MKRKLPQSRILLTGASSGIGAALALKLAAEGTDIVLLARRENRLQQLVQQIQNEYPAYAGGPHKIRYIAGDITNPDVRQNAVQTAQEQLGGIDILINNAGVGATALFEATTAETLRRIMEVNFFSLFELSQTVLPLLKESAASEERKKNGIRPMVVNLGSIVGLRGVPHYGIYGAAKFAVTGLSESIRAELSRNGIDVLLVCPGTTQTEFFDVLQQSTSAPVLPVHRAASPQYVAERIVKAMKQGRHRIIPYFPAVLLDYLNRFAPGFTDWVMARYV
jgi:short-subunit dehydrogenase